LILRRKFQVKLSTLIRFSLTDHASLIIPEHDRGITEPGQRRFPVEELPEGGDHISLMVAFKAHVHREALSLVNHLAGAR
jgi:hypothetical protein